MMKTMFLARSIRIALLAAAVAAPMAFAQDAATPPPTPMQDGSMQSTPAPSPTTAMTDDKMSDAKPMSWKELDANKDGKLSKDEVAGDATLTADFDTADANKDGYLSKAEFKAHKADMKKVAKK